MESVITVASYICRRYQEVFHSKIDEMKLHKLLYFAQREAIIVTGNPMFVEQFQAWRLGPVMPIIREAYHRDLLHNTPSEEFTTRYSEVINFIISHYAIKSAISLSDLSHGEYSWQHARRGLGIYDSCEREILTEDIRIDAENIRKRRVMLSLLKKQ